MMPPMTFGQLYDRLRELGFTPQELDWKGIPRLVFQHDTIANAMINLPVRDRNEEVEPFYMNSVLTTLRSHRLLPERNPLLT